MSVALTEQTQVEPQPTLSDVRQAVAEVSELPEVAAVHLFGSVAKQQAKHGSDIDLLVVIKDLDYENRKLWSKRISNMVRQSTGVPCDAVIRSVSEWHGRRQLSSSLETHVACTGIAMHEDAQSISNYRSLLSASQQLSPLPETHGGALSNSDMEDAVKRLREVSRHINAAFLNMAPGKDEIEEFVYRVKMEEWETLPSYLKNIFISLRQDRFLQILDGCERAVECSLKSLHHSLRGKFPAKTHWIGSLAQNLPNSPQKNKVQAILSPLRVSLLPKDYQDMPEPPTGEEYVNWREHATCIADEYNLYIPTSRVIDYLDIAEEICLLPLEQVLSDPTGRNLLEQKMGEGRDLKMQIDRLSNRARTLDIETGDYLSASSGTDIEKLIKIADSNLNQGLVSDEQKQYLNNLWQSRLAESHTNMISGPVALLPNEKTKQALTGMVAPKITEIL